MKFETTINAIRRNSISFWCDTYAYARKVSSFSRLLNVEEGARLEHVSFFF